MVEQCVVATVQKSLSKARTMSIGGLRLVAHAGKGNEESNRMQRLIVPDAERPDE
jgi:hypothetical protein